MEQISELETIFPPHGSGRRGWCAGLAFYLVPSILVSCLAPLPLLEASGALRITMRNKHTNSGFSTKNETNGEKNEHFQLIKLC